MSQSNESQIAFWSGDAGEQWVKDQEYLDALLQPLSEQALHAAAPNQNDRVLDVGCGCGTTSLWFAQHSAFVTGVDVSTPMVSWATQRGAGTSNTEFIEADASEWRGSEPYQLIFSRFGIMFFADPIAAFTNIRRNLVNGGRLCFICWRAPQDNPWLAVASGAVQPYLPEVPTPDGPDPFAFADPQFVSDTLTRAGFEKPQLTLTRASLNLGPTVEDAIGFLTRIGPLSRVMSELDGERQTRALSAAAKTLAPALTEHGVQLDASTWVVTAQAGTAVR